MSTTFVGQGIATGRADSGGIGVEAELLSGGIFTLAQGWGQIETTFIISGPGNEPIPVSINFELSGFLGGGTNLGVNIRTIENKAEITANAPNGPSSFYPYFGKAEETFDIGQNPGLVTNFAGDLAPSGGYCLGPACQIKTPVFHVYPGQTNNVLLWARATVTSFAGGSGFGQASFLNTFGFDPNQPVFNLPEGYTVTVEGLNVVDNCVVGGTCGENGGGGEVPEPGTYALVGAGLAAALFLRRRR